MESFEILALGGDGIGPEVLASGLAVAEAACAGAGVRLNITHDLLHGACWDVHGTFCRNETVGAAKVADALLVGSVGGPKWDHIRVEGGPEMQDGLIRLRRELHAYAGLRPARSWTALASQTPFRPGLAEGADIMVVREMSGGVMFEEDRGQSMRNGRRYAHDRAGYDEDEIARLAHAGFQLARVRSGRVVSTDKANVMESFKLWRTVVTEVAEEYPDVSLTHLYADNLAYQMMRNPKAFDVIICCNFLGDLLSDLAAVVSGSLGMLPSACLRDAPGRPVPGIFEPVHGSAPDIAGTGTANPVAMILSAAMMFEYALGRPDIARRIETAVEQVLKQGIGTPDIGGRASTTELTDAILSELTA